MDVLSVLFLVIALLVVAGIVYASNSSLFDTDLEVPFSITLITGDKEINFEGTLLECTGLFRQILLGKPLEVPTNGVIPPYVWFSAKMDIPNPTEQLVKDLKDWINLTRDEWENKRAHGILKVNTAGVHREYALEFVYPTSISLVRSYPADFPITVNLSASWNTPILSTSDSTSPN